MHTFGRSAALAFVAAVAIVGCKGADGKNGAPGAPGADLRPPMTAETCTYCHSAGGIADPTPFHNDAATAALDKKPRRLSETLFVIFRVPLDAVVKLIVNLLWLL